MIGRHENGASDPFVVTPTEDPDDGRIERGSVRYGFHTSAGQYGDRVPRVTISGSSIELCERHIAATRELNAPTGGFL